MPFDVPPLPAILDPLVEEEFYADVVALLSAGKVHEAHRAARQFVAEVLGDEANPELLDLLGRNLSILDRVFQADDRQEARLDADTRVLALEHRGKSHLASEFSPSVIAGNTPKSEARDLEDLPPGEIEDVFAVMQAVFIKDAKRDRLEAARRPERTE